MSATDPVQAVRGIGREHRPAKVNSVEGTLTCACGHVSAEWDGLELHRAELTIAAARPAIEREKAAALVRVRRYAEGHAITAKANGRDNRDWLDLLIILDQEADQ